jgi:sugar/nucleoside kinase (ribokinase family)
MYSRSISTGDDVLDISGAIDAFIRLILYFIATGTPPRTCTVAAPSAVAAWRCTAPGARPGQPLQSDLDAEQL